MSAHPVPWTMVPDDEGGSHGLYAVKDAAGELVGMVPGPLARQLVALSEGPGVVGRIQYLWDQALRERDETVSAVQHALDGTKLPNTGWWMRALSLWDAVTSLRKERDAARAALAEARER